MPGFTIRWMIGYAFRRCLQLIPTLFLITLLLFVGMQAVPGGPMQAFAQDINMSQAARDAIIHRWGLDQPVGVQYYQWLTSMFSGDWQTSFFRNRPVRDVIASTLPATLLLMTTAFILQELIALPAGILAALRRYSVFDQAITLFSYVGYSMPTFWLGLMLLLIFAVEFRIAPVAGVIDIRLTGAPFLTPEYNTWFSHNILVGIFDVAHHIILPAITIAIVGIAGDSRFMRSSMLDTIHQDYVRTARAKGLPERSIVLKHALRNALLPVITNVAYQLPGLFSGAVVTEAIFSWPGMGQLFFEALTQFDYPLLMGILFVTAVLVLFFNLLADLAYAIADPRISYA